MNIERFLKAIDPATPREERLPKEDLKQKAESLFSTFTQREDAGVQEVRELIGSDVAYADKKQILKELKHKLHESGSANALHLVEQEAKQLS